VEKLITELGTAQSWLTYTHFILANGLNKINSNIIRNEGYLNSLKSD
jgi:hypothetical protein